MKAILAPSERDVLDTAPAEIGQAQAELDAAREALKVSEYGTRSPQIAQQRLADARAHFDRAQSFTSTLTELDS